MSDASGTDEASEEGPERWCYDALVARTWGSGDGEQVAILRTLEVVWSHFDPHPLVFAPSVAAVQPCEEFLAGEPAVPTPSERLIALREHLLAARTPGRSTWIEASLAAGAIGAAQVLSFRWLVDGHDPSEHQVPGPGSIRMAAEALPAGGIWRRRALAEPGRRRVVLLATVATPQPRGMPRQATARIEATVEVVAHQPTRLHVSLDASGPRPILTRAP